MMLFWTWVLLFLLCVYLIGKITDAKITIYGGGFILSLVVFLVIYSFSTKAAERDKARAIQEAQAKIAATEAKRVAEEERERQREEKAAADREKCKADLECWSRKNYAEAISKCQSLIEKHAKYSFKWTDGMLDYKLTRYMWKDKSRLTLSYFGDKIQFQNGFGAWQNMIYRCDYDPVNDKLLDIEVKPGRF